MHIEKSTNTLEKSERESQIGILNYFGNDNDLAMIHELNLLLNHSGNDNDLAMIYMRRTALTTRLVSPVMTEIAVGRPSQELHAS